MPGLAATAAVQRSTVVKRNPIKTAKTNLILLLRILQLQLPISVSNLVFYCKLRVPHPPLNATFGGDGELTLDRETNKIGSS